MLRSLVVAALLAVSVSAQGGQPADALKTCLADSTSGKDRKDLAKWIFLAMAAHPEMNGLLTANLATELDESSKKIAALFTRLLTESCLSETRAVVATGQGSQSISLAFEGLGQLAMQELMAHKSVQDSMGYFERYLDQKRLMAPMAGE